MKHAIATLEAALAAVETNEPINRAAGKIDQADLDLAVAGDCRAAIAALSAENPVRVMRAKFKIATVLVSEHAEKIAAGPVCRTGSYPADGSDEDNTFALFSPSGSLELNITNPALRGALKPGEKYYLDFTKAPN